MVQKTFSKNLILATGILAALVILLSQAFQQDARTFLSKIKTDQSEKPAGAEKKVVIATPSDAVVASQAGEVGDTKPALIREIILDADSVSERPVVPKTIIASFFKTLFRTIISPQAP